MGWDSSAARREANLARTPVGGGRRGRRENAEATKQAGLVVDLVAVGSRRDAMKIAAPHRRAGDA